MNLTIESYNDAAQFVAYFQSLPLEDRADYSEVEGDFDLESFVDESWAD